MKRKLLIQGGIAMAVLLVLAFGIGVGQAYATTGCFTDTVGSPFETFICWMNDNGITTGTGPGLYSPNDPVTRGQMAVFMQRQAEIPPSTGVIQVVMSPSNWNVHYIDLETFNVQRYFTDTRFVYAAGTGHIDYFVAAPDLSTALYGRKLSLVGAEICYNTVSANITNISVYVDTQSAGTATFFVTPVSDNTLRIDAKCQNYTFAPVVLTGESIVNVGVSGDFIFAGSNELDLGRVTFVLQPTTTLATPLAAPQPAMPGTDQPQPGDSKPELAPQPDGPRQ